jgi:hypothetical protein
LSYYEIFVIGWKLNALMFLSNLVLAFSSFRAQDINQMQKQSSILGELKSEHESLFPTRKYETLISYFIPFTAFFRIAYRYFEMFMFFKSNKDSAMFDYMVYSYTKDINKKKGN